MEPIAVNLVLINSHWLHFTCKWEMWWIIPAENSWDTEPFFKKSKNTTNEAEETECREAYFQSVGKEKLIIKKYICACTAHCVHIYGTVV